MYNSEIKIVVPVYKPDFLSAERVSLDRCFELLADHFPIDFVLPENLDASHISQIYPKGGLVRFDDSFFSSLSSYNRLMLSAEFYERFLNSKYILVYQPDCYIFRDELAEWCERGYDYVGAPWLAEERYRSLYYRIKLAYKRMKKLRHGDNDRSNLFFRIGNGGFSLREVHRHYEVACSGKGRIQRFREHCDDPYYNEDIFWGVHTRKFRKPDFMTALTFAIDEDPKQAIGYINGKLPMGCHGWSKERNIEFWKNYIQGIRDVENDKNES